MCQGAWDIAGKQLCKINEADGNPARIKKGMARRLNTEIPENILCAPVSTAAPVSSTGRMAQMDDTARATAMGTPARSMMTSNTNMINPQATAIFISYTSSFPLKSL